MAFSVSRSRPLRALGLRKSSGKHAAPKGWAPEPRPDSSSSQPHRPAHAATSPRLTGPHAAVDSHTDVEQLAEAEEQAATEEEDADTQVA